MFMLSCSVCVIVIIKLPLNGKFEGGGALTINGFEEVE